MGSPDLEHLAYSAAWKRVSRRTQAWRRKMHQLKKREPILRWPHGGAFDSSEASAVTGSTEMEAIICSRAVRSRTFGYVEILRAGPGASPSTPSC